MPPLAALRAFEAAARHLSFQKAAEELAVTPTAISHQIRLLEETLGLALFERHVRRVSLTGAGQSLFPVLQEGFDSFARAVAALHPPLARRAVTLTAPTFFMARCLLPALGTFHAHHPQFDVHFHAADTVVDLHAGGADAAVRYGIGPFPGLESEKIGTDRFGVVCSPALDLRTHADLARTPLIHMDWKRRERVPDWRQWRQHAKLSAQDLDIDAGARFTDDSHALQAAVAGHGVAIASLTLVRAELAAGLLVHPFGPVLDGDSYYFLTTPAKAQRPDVQAVRAWVRDVWES